MSEEDISFENHFKKTFSDKNFKVCSRSRGKYKKKFLQGERLKRLNKTEWVVQIILGK